jgi:hypothetical protein
MNPCRYKPLGQSVLAITAPDSISLNQVVNLKPNNWITNYNAQNYIGNLGSNNCNEQNPYLIQDVCRSCSG